MGSRKDLVGLLLLGFIGFVTLGKVCSIIDSPRRTAATGKCRRCLAQCLAHSEPSTSDGEGEGHVGSLWPRLFSFQRRARTAHQTALVCQEPLIIIMFSQSLPFLSFPDESIPGVQHMGGPCPSHNEGLFIRCLSAPVGGSSQATWWRSQDYEVGRRSQTSLNFEVS